VGTNTQSRQQNPIGFDQEGANPYQQKKKGKKGKGCSAMKAKVKHIKWSVGNVNGMGGQVRQKGDRTGEGEPTEGQTPLQGVGIVYVHQLFWRRKLLGRRWKEIKGK